MCFIPDFAVHLNDEKGYALSGITYGADIDESGAFLTPRNITGINNGVFSLKGTSGQYTLVNPSQNVTHLSNVAFSPKKADGYRKLLEQSTNAGTLKIGGVDTGISRDHVMVQNGWAMDTNRRLVDGELNYSNGHSIDLDAGQGFEAIGKIGGQAVVHTQHGLALVILGAPANEGTRDMVLGLLPELRSEDFQTLALSQVSSAPKAGEHSHSPQ